MTKLDQIVVGNAVKFYLDTGCSSKLAGEKFGISECSVLRGLVKRGIEQRHQQIIDKSKINEILKRFSGGYKYLTLLKI